MDATDALHTTQFSILRPSSCVQDTLPLPPGLVCGGPPTRHVFNRFRAGGLAHPSARRSYPATWIGFQPPESFSLGGRRSHSPPYPTPGDFKTTPISTSGVSLRARVDLNLGISLGVSDRPRQEHFAVGARTRTARHRTNSQRLIVFAFRTVGSLSDASCQSRKKC